MKRRICVLALTALLILGLSIANALGASVNYLGKTTWTSTITATTVTGVNPGDTFTITGGISKVGDEFYLFQGYVTSDTDGPFVISGSGFMMGNTLVFTCSESQQHSGSSHDSGVMHITINKTDLSGTFYDIGLDYDTTGKTFDQRYTAGTLALAGSPIPLTSSLAPQQLLLLD
ncbi:MAG: hypothetical protein AB1424_08020 [Thermodesulfobacteriota bacterium]